jgi:hypothetical protein
MKITYGERPDQHKRLEADELKEGVVYFDEEARPTLYDNGYTIAFDGSSVYVMPVDDDVQTFTPAPKGFSFRIEAD